MQATAQKSSALSPLPTDGQKASASEVQSDQAGAVLVSDNTSSHRLKLGVLVSGSGSNLQAILDAIESGVLHANICCVISNVPDVYALERARKANIPTFVIPHRHVSGRQGFEQALIDQLLACGAEWIAMAGFMRVLTGHFLRAFSQRVINIHPALLPAFPGMHGQAQALEYGVRLAGATVHLVDEGVDTGPILCQGVVPVLDSDTEESLKARILTIEHQIYPRALQLLASCEVKIEGRRVRFEPRGGKSLPPQEGGVADSRPTAGPPGSDIAGQSALIFP